MPIRLIPLHLRPGDIPMASQFIVEAAEWAPDTRPYLSPEAVLGAGDSYWYSALNGAELVGIVGFVGVNHIDRRADVAMGVVPKWRGHGMAKDLALAQNDFGFNDLGLDRLQMVALTDSPSCAIARSAGLVLEGTLKHCRFKRGKWHDASVYALVRGV